MNPRPEKTREQQLAAYEAWYDEQVRLGLEDIEAGRVLSHEEVVKKLDRHMKLLEKKYAVKAA
jgi:predicted transcriptional regulator